MHNFSIFRDSFFWLASIFFYYKLFKGLVFYLAHRAVSFRSFGSLHKKYTPQELTGVLELGLVATSHVLFCIFLILILNLNIEKLGLFEFQPHHLLYGCLLGIGEMSLSSLFCLAAIKVMQKTAPHKGPQNNNQWQTVARGGWIKHHIQSFELLPIFASLIILFLQVGSEELIFRGIITNSLLENGYGHLLSISFSIVVFVGMQAFHMPGLRSAIFPMIGALVMGITHSLLYYFVPVLPPLIIAHVVFFLMTVI